MTAVGAIVGNGGAVVGVACGLHAATNKVKAINVANKVYIFFIFSLSLNLMFGMEYLDIQ